MLRDAYWSKTASTRTQRLYVVLVETPFDVFDHQTCLADLGVSHHPHLNHDAGAIKRALEINMTRNRQ